MTDSMHSALEIWREGNAAALEAVGYVIDADLCRRGQFDEMPSAKAFQEIIANALAKPPMTPRTARRFMMDELPIVTRLQKADAVNFPIKTQELCYQAADRITELVEALREIKYAWDWWQLDTHDRCASVVDDAIRAALAKALEASNE